MNPMWELLWLHSWQYGCVRFNLATAKKRFVRPPMVALLAIWLHSLSILAKKMVARHPMIPLLAIWLQPLTWLPPKKWLRDLLFGYRQKKWLRDLLWLR